VGRKIIRRRERIRYNVELFYPILTIETTLAKKKSDEDSFISNFIKVMYPSTVKFDGFDEEQ